LVGPALANHVNGCVAADNERALLSGVIQELDAEEITASDKGLLINISRPYRSGMSPMERYDATRGVWKVLEPSYCTSMPFHCLPFTPPIPSSTPSD